jgi:hypothetical protein
VFEADKHIEFLEDPDALVDDFEGLDGEKVEELKRELCDYLLLISSTDP